MSLSSAILAADSNDRNLELLTQLLGKADYRVEGTSELADLDLKLAKTAVEFELALIDVSGFDASIWQRCDRLNRLGVPWLAFCAAHQEVEVQQQGYRYGIRGVLVKPVDGEALVRTIHDVLASLV